MLFLLLACQVDGGPGELVVTEEGWYLTFGAKYTDEGWGIAEDSESGDLFVATHQGAPKMLPDLYAYRMSIEGEVLWERHWDGPEGSASELAYIAVENNGILYVGGHSYGSLDTESSDALLVAYNAEDGTILWWWEYDGLVGYEEIDGIVVEGNKIWVSGWTTTEEGGLDILVAQLNLDGEEQWVKAIDGVDLFGEELEELAVGGGNRDEANGHLVADADNLYLGGLSGGIGYVDGGNAMVAAVSKEKGEVVWATMLDDNAGLWDDVLGIQLFDGQLFAIGSKSGGSFDAPVWCLSTTGELIWEDEIGGTGAESSRSLAGEGDRLWAAVNSSSGNSFGGTDMLLVPIDPATGPGEAEIIIGGSGNEEVHDLVVSGGFATVVGQTTSVGAGKEDAIVVREPLSAHTVELK
jgi:hypothetical protein